jgi:hypothetical protein
MVWVIDNWPAMLGADDGGSRDIPPIKPFHSEMEDLEPVPA